jgi:hypothetical protein
LDANNNPVFESVVDGKPSLSGPTWRLLHDAPINVGNISPNQAVIGIWILREIDEDKIP